MTNEALFRLFSKFGNVISARIMVEKATGRSRGFGEKAPTQSSRHVKLSEIITYIVSSVETKTPLLLSRVRFLDLLVWAD